MHLEEFAQGGSLWHRMDPRVKLVSAGCFALTVALVDSMAALLLAVLLAAGALASARLDPRQVAVRMGVVNIFLLFLWLFLPFTADGGESARLGPLTVHGQGVLLAVRITLKANAVAGVTIALLGTSSIFHLVHGLTHLKVPGRLVQLFFFCYRYISVIHGEYLRLRASMRLRCFSARTDLHTYRSLAYLMGMLFVRSFDRSERIYQAMVLRGFDGTFWTLNHFHMRRSDWVALLLMLMSVGALVAVQVAGGGT